MLTNRFPIWLLAADSGGAGSPPAGDPPVNPPAGDPPATTPPTDSDGEPFDKERAMATIRNLREQEKELKKAQKRLAELEDAEAKRKGEQLTELEKAQAAAKAAEDRARKLELKDLQRQAAEKFSLPASLATRLQGETLEDLEKDAENLVKTLPKETKTAPKLPPNNPGGNGSGGTGETDEQRRKRLLG
jgi:DNA repair exonuclease SbcCD ATPase subunit